jgi:hypothetical protein
MTSIHPTMRQMLDSPWLRVLIAVCVFLLLHLPFSLLTIQSEASFQEKPGIHLPAVVSLPPATTGELSEFERDLYAWAEIADPRQMLLPNLQHGFSSFGNPGLMRQEPSLPVWSLEPFFWPRKDFPESSLAVKSKTLPELIRQQWNQNTDVFLLPFGKTGLPDGVFWRLAGTQREIRDIVMPEEFFALAGNSSEVDKISDMTVLEVSSLATLPYPRVILRKSCGSVLFDQLAIRALKEHFLACHRQKGRAAPTPLKDGKSWLLEVDWRLPDFGGGR